jgi:hypothetical protein
MINHITVTNDAGEKRYATSLLFYVISLEDGVGDCVQQLREWEDADNA